MAQDKGIIPICPDLVGRRVLITGEDVIFCMDKITCYPAELIATHRLTPRRFNLLRFAWGPLVNLEALATQELNER